MRNKAILNSKFFYVDTHGQARGILPFGFIKSWDRNIYKGIIKER